MRLIERYLFRQLLTPTLLAAAALGAVGLLSQSLGQLDIIIEQRQTAWVFLKVIVLAMPQLLNLILPIAVFVAALIGLNRLHAEHELVVCYAAGMSRWRVMAPGLRLAVMATLVGVLILGILDNGLTQLNVDSYVREVLIGAIVVAAVAVSSYGRKRV